MDKLDKDKLVIAGYKYHAPSGCTFIIAHAPGKVRFNKAGVKKPEYIKDGYIVAWVAPEGRQIRKYNAFDSYHYAHAHFMQFKDNDPPPKLPYIRDFQQQKVYDWENKNIKGSGARLSKRKAEAFVKTISEEFNLQAPGLNFRQDSSDEYCYFKTEKHEIGGHAQFLNMGFLVHECAHMVDTYAGNVNVTHGPSFVKNLIDLADKYIKGNEKEKLLKSAKEAGLLGLPEEIHYVEPPPNPLVTAPKPRQP